MTTRRHQRQGTVVDLRPTRSQGSLQASSLPPLGSAAASVPESLPQSKSFPRGKNRYFPGSVFIQAQLIAGTSESSSESNESSVEVIVSELENLTQASLVSDSSQLTARECDDSVRGSEWLPAEDLRDSMKDVQDACRRQCAERSTQRREVLTQVLSQVKDSRTPPRPDNEIAVKAALMRLVPQQRHRETAIASVNSAQTRRLYLLIAEGKVQGVYSLERAALRRLMCLGSGRESVPFSSVKRWFRLEGLGFKVVFSYQYRHADAFSL